MPMNLTLTQLGLSPDQATYVSEIDTNLAALANGGTPPPSSVAPPAPATSRGANASPLANPVTWVVGIAAIAILIVLVSKRGG